MPEFIRKNVKILVGGAPISVAKMTTSYPNDWPSVREPMPEMSFDCELAPVKPNRRQRRAEARQRKRNSPKR